MDHEPAFEERIIAPTYTDTNLTWMGRDGAAKWILFQLPATV